jgi:class 3 adenylate cyclase
MRGRILVVGRDVGWRARLARTLGAAGYGAELAESVAQAQRIGRRGIALAIVAPAGLGREGEALIDELNSTVGKTLLVAEPGVRPGRGGEVVEAGDAAALLGRVAAALQPAAEAKTEAEPVLQFAQYRLDLAGHSLTDAAGTAVALTRGEFALLRALVQRPGRVLSRDYLLQALAGREAEAYDRSIDMLVVRLRRKIEPDPKQPRLIVTVPGSGYKFAARVRAAEVAAAEPASAVEVAAAVPAAERRHLTALAAELVGVLPEDPEELRAVVAAFRRAAAAVIARHGGTVAQCHVRQVLAWFGYPVAQEHAAERALHAALALAQPAAEGGAALPAGFSVRVGVASGLVLADPGGEVLGETPAVAARLHALAAPGQVLVAADTRRLAGELFSYRALAPAGGVGGDAPAWQVLGPSALASRSEALHAEPRLALVGREEELDALRRAWRQARDGAGRLVLLAGEPGIGKSRLLAALEEALAGEGYASLRYFCSPLHQNSALHPVIARWQQAAGFTREDTAGQRLEKLEAVLRLLELSGEEIALIAALLAVPTGGRYPALDLSPLRHKERTFAALLRTLLAQARRAPLLMLFEDAHWADPSSLEMLDVLVERLAGLPVLLVVSYRPDFAPPWAGRPGTSLLALSRLDRAQAATLAAQVATQVAAGPALAPALLDRILVRADGVPLFIEELTRAVLETAATDPAHPLAVPATLHGPLMARLDRLPAAKPIAQIGAAIGRAFSGELLMAVAELPEVAVRKGLDELVHSGLALSRGTPPHVSYSFRHALMQDAAYESLLRADRRRLHARIVAALETHGAELPEHEPEILARHCDEAGLAQKAAAWWLRAGTESLRRGAVAEALRQFSRGLAAIPGIDDTDACRRLELDLWIARIKTLMAAEGHAATSLPEALGRARELSEQLSGHMRSCAETSSRPCGRQRNCWCSPRGAAIPSGG